jgi:hypothetical protein
MVIPLIPAAVWSMAEVWSRLFARIVVSYPAESMDVHLLCWLYVVYVAASAISWSLDQRSATGCVCLCVSV